jgi:uncharacterized protein (TIGR00251 family)
MTARRPSSTESTASAAPAWPCLRQHGTQPVLDVSVSPNARKTELVGWHDGALRIRLQAPPVDGAANEALCKWLATSLGLTARQVTLLRGDTSRRKQLALDCDAAVVSTWLSSQPALRNQDPDADKA